MNREEFKIKWDNIKSKLKSKWSKLTDHEVEEIDGNVDILISKLHKYYGISPEEAEMEVDQWFRIS
ncbi:CsbD family protein [Alkaliphilus transvaalensis]|uniref:hypothetical protein n=1 Tax=Alkaliphilus transvaalensis TaxID=114628 RepID=UPI0004792CA8|nr:hypothetical protein [Alkaliphilus transvaalensis]